MMRPIKGLSGVGRMGQKLSGAGRNAPKIVGNREKGAKKCRESGVIWEFTLNYLNSKLSKEFIQ